jgi:hypothetical protein
MAGRRQRTDFEQVLLWDPEVIVTIDKDLAATVRQDRPGRP